MLRRSQRWILSAAVGGALISAGLVWGQARIHLRVNGNNVAPSDDKATPPGVSVPDSPGAVERIEKARDKETQKQWKTAAEFYLEAITKFPGRVVPVRVDGIAGIFQYAGIAQVVQEQLAKWPDEGLKVYNNLYGQTAADLLTAAPRGDTGALLNIFWTYFATDAGKAAGIRLVDSYFEDGNFQAAAWIGNRLLSFHPALLGDRGMIVYRTALACSYAGDHAAATALLDRLKQDNGNDIASIGGKDVRLVDSLTAMLAAAPPVPTTLPSDADTYPSFGGRGSRGEISLSTARPGASLKTVELTPPDYLGLMGSQRAAFMAADEQSISNNRSMGIIPVVDNGTLFFQDGRSLYAVDVDSGAPLPGWLDTYGGERNGRYKVGTFGRARSELLTVTVSSKAVLAVMGQSDLSTMIGQAQGAASTLKLICLDRETGRELWTRTPAELPESASALHTADYGGTPLIIPAAMAGRGVSGNLEDSVLITARGGKENQFDDCYVVCLSLKTGQYRWSTYVGSATRSVNMEGLTEGDPSQMAFADGRVFVMTNLGTVAAIDPSNGRVIWLNSYVRDSNENPQDMIFRNRRMALQNAGVSSANPWAHNPVFVSDGSVFILPNDAHKLFIYDAGSGAQQKRLPMSICDNADLLLGVRNDSVALISSKRVYAFNWKKVDPENPDLRPTEISFSDEATTCGRGFITSDSIFVPTTNRLVQIEWKGKETGRIISVYPSFGKFSGAQGPGNLLVTANNVVVAGQTQVDIYTTLSLVKKRYELAIANAPADPEPLINYAIALFSGGQLNDALARTDQAIDLMGGPNNLRSVKGRSLTFNTMLDFARRAGKGSQPNKSVDGATLTDEFFNRAALTAETPVEQATYRLARAKSDEQSQKQADGVQLCQQILLDDMMRNAVLPDETTAGTAAEAAIAAAISHDRSIYAPIEQDAARALTTARAGSDPDQLVAVAVLYPNSMAAVEARQTAVERFEAQNQPEKAIDVLRRMYTDATDNAARVHLLESIANDFLALPHGVGPALDRLCRAARIAPSGGRVSQKLRLPDGTTLGDETYADAITALRKIQTDQDTEMLPDLHLPTARSRAVTSPFAPGRPDVLSNVTGLVHPLRDYTRHDQLVTWSPAGLAIYTVGQTTPISVLPAVDKEPLAAAWIHNNWLVWTSGGVYQISGDGKIGWTFSLQSLPPIPVSSGGDAVVDDTGETGADESVNGNVRLINVQGQLIPVGPGGFNRGRLLRLNGGMVVPPPVPPVIDHFNQEQIKTAQPGGGGLIVSTSTGRIVAINIGNGQTLWQARPTDHAVDQLLANGHFTVARMDDPGGSQLAVYDTATGRLIGRRRFGPDATPSQLVNVALSEEATLAITLFNRAMVKDLYDPWKVAPVELGAQSNRDAAPFVQLNQQDQLVLHGGRLVFLYDSGSYARGYDLSKNADPTNPLNTYANSNSAVLRLVGSRVFIVTGKGMIEYNLDDPTDHYEGQLAYSGDYTPKVRGLILGKDFAVVINDPVDRGPAGSLYETLMAYSRAKVKDKNHESGLGTWNPVMKSTSGITDWISVEGGFYYVENNNTATFLRGARQ